MPSKIENKSIGKDYARRDFKSAEVVDKHGNHTCLDNAGNIRLVAVEDGNEAPDFSYQKKYNLQVGLDEEGNNQVNASVLDDAFIENLVNQSKGLIEGGSYKASKSLPDGEISLDVEDQELQDNQKKTLEEIVLAYDKIKEIQQTDMSSIDLIEQIEEPLDKNIKTSKLQVISEISLKIPCQYCDEEILLPANFCQNCGEKRIKVCAECNFEIVGNNNFCGNCGNKLK